MSTRPDPPPWSQANPGPANVFSSDIVLSPTNYSLCQFHRFELQPVLCWQTYRFERIGSTSDTFDAVNTVILNIITVASRITGQVS